jgi:hypothetical protein
LGWLNGFPWTVALVGSAGAIHFLESTMLSQFQFYLDTPEGHRMEGETVLYRSSTLDEAIKRAGKMLKARTFYFGKANLCIIKDQDGHVLREVRINPSQQMP